MYSSSSLQLQKMCLLIRLQRLEMHSPRILLSPVHRRMLSGFMSPWIYPIEWSYYTLVTNWRPINRTSFFVNGYPPHLLIKVQRLLPSFSITINSRFSSKFSIIATFASIVPQSIIFGQTLGNFSSNSDIISTSAFAEPVVIILMTSDLSPSQQLQTLPKLPSPMSSSIT